MEKMKYIKASSVVLFSTLFSSLLFAQEAQNDTNKKDEALELEPLEISAMRFDDSVFETPITGVKISEKQIENSGLTSVSEVLNRYSDVFIRNTGGGIFMGQPSLRGFGENSQSRVLVLLDGQKLNPIDMGGINWGQIQLNDVDNIEVLYGAQSATYGGFAESGVIKISSKKWGKNGAKFGGTYGEHGEYSAYGTLNYSNDDYYVSASANYYHNSGYFANSLNWNKSATFSAGAKIDSQNEVGMYVNLGNMFISWPGYIYASSAPEFKDLYPNNLNHTQEDSVKYMSAVLSWDNKTSYGEGSAHLGFNVRDRSTLNISSWSPNYIVDSTLWTLSFDPKYRVYFGEQEKSFVEGGLDFYYDNFSAERSGVYFSKIDRVTVSPWLGGKLQLNDIFSLTASARYEGVINKAVSEASSLDDNELVNGFAAQFGINAKITDEWNVYFRFDQIYHYPTIDERYSLWGYGPMYNNPDLDPEHGQNYEIGTNFSKYGFTFGGSLFYTHLNNEIAYDGILYGNINIGETDRYGAQIRLAYEYEKMIGAFTSWTFLSAQYASGSYKDRDVPVVPNVVSKSGIWVKPLEYFMVELNYVWSGRQYQYGYTDPWGPTSKMSENYSLDLTVNVYPCENARIFFGISNITDHKNCTYATWNCWYPEPGRTIRGGVEIKF